MRTQESRFCKFTVELHMVTKYKPIRLSVFVQDNFSSHDTESKETRNIEALKAHYVKSPYTFKLWKSWKNRTEMKEINSKDDEIYVPHHITAHTGECKTLAAAWELTADKKWAEVTPREELDPSGAEGASLSSQGGKAAEDSGEYPNSQISLELCYHSNSFLTEPTWHHHCVCVCAWVLCASEWNTFQYREICLVTVGSASLVLCFTVHLSI